MAAAPPSPSQSGSGARPRARNRLRLRRGRERERENVISAMEDHTTVDEDTGAVRSVQAADLVVPETALREVWTPAHLERLARTYWRFLARITLGLVHVHYGESERSVVFLLPAIRLITFAEPEYETGTDHGLVRWRIERGLLVAGAGRRAAQTANGPAGGPERHEAGHLQIEVRRVPESKPGRARLHIEVEVANFYPAIAFALGRRLYNTTQSRIHVLITHAFLRSLARARRRGGVLAESKVGRLAGERAGRGGS